MTRLVYAELRRIAARRLVRITAALVVVGIVVGGVLAFATMSSISEAQYDQRARVAQAQEQAQRVRSEACVRAHGISPAGDVPASVGEACAPRKLFAASDPRFHRKRLGDLLKGVAGVLAIVGWALGASFVGAEFASRSMTTLLTWETRRTRVFAAKTAVVLVTAAVGSVLALLALALALLPALLVHGAPLRADDPGIATLAGLIARGALFATVAAAMGMAIAAIGRNTAAALGAGFAYILVLENILGNSLRDWRRWLLLGNAIVFVSGRASADIPGRSVAGAGLFLVAVALALLVGAAATFRIRDIA